MRFYLLLVVSIVALSGCNSSNKDEPILDNSVVVSSEIITQNENESLDMSDRKKALLAKYGIVNIADNPEFEVNAAMVEFGVSTEEIQSIKDYYKEYMESLESAAPAGMSFSTNKITASEIEPKDADVTSLEGLDTLERMQALIAKYGIENVVNNQEFDLESAMIEFGVSIEDIDSF